MTLTTLISSHWILTLIATLFLFAYIKSKVESAIIGLGDFILIWGMRLGIGVALIFMIIQVMH